MLPRWLASPSERAASPVALSQSRDDEHQSECWSNRETNVEPIIYILVTARYNADG